MATHTSDQIVGSAIAELSGIFRRDRPVEHGGDPYLVPSTANFERSSVKSTAALSLTLNSNALLFKPHGAMKYEQFTCITGKRFVFIRVPNRTSSCATIGAVAISMNYDYLAITKKS